MAVKKIPVKLQHSTCNFWRVTRSFDLGLYWKFKKVTQRSTSNLPEILMRRTLLHIKLEHDEGKFWGIIIFTRICKMLPFEHELVQKVKRSDKSQHQTCLRFWCREYLCKVTTWCMQLLRSQRVHKATWPWASLKIHKGHTKVNVKLFRDFDVENIPINLQH